MTPSNTQVISRRVPPLLRETRTQISKRHVLDGAKSHGDEGFRGQRPVPCQGWTRAPGGG